MITDDLRTLGWSVADLAAAALNIASGGPAKGRVLELRRAGWTFGQILDAIRSTTRLLTVDEDRELRRLIRADAVELVRAVARQLREAAGTEFEPESRRVLARYGFRSAEEVERLTDDEIRLAVEVLRSGARG